MPTKGKLEALTYPSDIHTLGFRRHDFPGPYCDLRGVFKAMPGQDALVWVTCDLVCPETMRLLAILGYERPIKMWLDGRLRHFAPVGSLMYPDPATVRVPFIGTGRHTLLFALVISDGNVGGVWIQLGRCDKLRGSATCLPRVETGPINDKEGWITNG
jgi:hypothetical protein